MPLATRTGTPAATADSALDRAGGVVDEVDLGEHDDGCGAAVEREHQLSLEPPLVGRRGERVHQHDRVDVRGDRLRLRAISFERRPAHERAAPRQHALHPLAVLARQHPVADRDVDADVADPQRCLVEVDQQRAPAAIEPRDARRTATAREIVARADELVHPAESEVATYADDVQGTVGPTAHEQGRLPLSGAASTPRPGGTAAQPAQPAPTPAHLTREAGEHGRPT